MFQSNEMIFPLDSVQPFVFFYRNLDFEILKEFYIKTRWLSNFLPPADKCNLLSPENCLENDNIFVKRRTFHTSEIYIIIELEKIIIRNMGTLWSEIQESGYTRICWLIIYISANMVVCKYFAHRLVRLVVREKVSNKRSNTFSGMPYDLYFWKYS